MTAGAAAVSMVKACRSMACAAPGGITGPGRHNFPQRRRNHHQPAIARPRIAPKLPGLGDEGAAGLRLDLETGAGNQSRDHIVVVIVLDAQVGLGVSQRNGFDGGGR
jgi:hypothetical protein